MEVRGGGERRRKEVEVEESGGDNDNGDDNGDKETTSTITMATALKLLLLLLRLHSLHFRSILPSVADAYFSWLLCGNSLVSGHLRPWCISFLLIFCCSIQHPNNGITLPPCLPLVAPTLHSPLRCELLFSVGCCV